MLCDNELYSALPAPNHILSTCPSCVWGAQLRAELMPDGLHPSAAGMEQIFGRCLAPLVDELLQS